VLAHESGLIVGQAVTPSDEGAAVAPLLDQHEATLAGPPTVTLLDAGYHNSAVLGLFVERGLDVLCPSGAVDQGRWTKAAAPGRYPKAAFRYDEERDQYVCPAGCRLRFREAARDRHGQPRRRYGGAPCAACGQRGACTTAAKQGRTLWRYPVDELKEAMAQVLAQPAARRAYRRRQAIVEPRFAAICDRLGLRRFHRFGLAGARLEFALYCVAHNLQHGLRLLAQLFAVFYRFLAAREPHQGPQVRARTGFRFFGAISLAPARRIFVTP
jgi:hypothetical protein